MILNTRSERQRENKILLVKVLEHIINVTNLGLNLSEINHNLIISYPPQSYYHYDSGCAIVRKAELIFTLGPNNDLKVRHRWGCNDDISMGEIIAELPPGVIDEKFIYENVINFLQVVKSR